MYFTKILSRFTTKTGSTVIKGIVPQNGLGNVQGKIIKYAPDSKMAKLGITHVATRDAGMFGKTISVFSGQKELMTGVTRPDGFMESFPSITDKLRKYLKKAQV